MDECIMKAMLACLVLTCSTFAVCANIAWVIGANKEAPKLDHAHLDVSPLIQGVEGTLTIQTYVQVVGKC